MGAWAGDVILLKAKGRIDEGAIKSIGEAFERKEGTEMTYAVLSCFLFPAARVFWNFH